jgi:hypothetical protein
MLSSSCSTADIVGFLFEKPEFRERRSKMTKRKVSAKAEARLPGRKVSAKEKARLAVSSLPEGVNKTKFCAKYGISRSTLYAWQGVVLSRLSEDL